MYARSSVYWLAGACRQQHATWAWISTRLHANSGDAVQDWAIAAQGVMLKSEVDVEADLVSLSRTYKHPVSVCGRVRQHILNLSLSINQPLAVFSIQRQVATLRTSLQFS